jgi:hypothetical protein
MVGKSHCLGLVVCDCIIVTCVIFSMAISDMNNVEAIQQHLELLAAQYKSRGNGKNYLQPRHLKDEFQQTTTRTTTTTSSLSQEQEEDYNAKGNSMDEAMANVLFDDFARVVCKANAVPRKELFEAWAMALYVHHHFPWDQSRRIADLACSHGLLSWALMYLDDHQPINEYNNDSDRKQKHSTFSMQPRTAICIDLKMPLSVEKLQCAMTEQWPSFQGRWDYVEGRLEYVVASPSTLLVGIHCCGTLSDKVIDLAVAANAPLALVPCCHTRKCLSKEQNQILTVTLKEEQEKDGTAVTLAEYIDRKRIERLREAGYTVQEKRIPQVITPKNRIILAIPTTKVEAQDVAPLLTDVAYTTAVRKYLIPVGNSCKARSEVVILGGREAANLRRRKLPPHLSVSILLPHPEAVSIQDVKQLSEEVAKDYQLYCDGGTDNLTVSTSVEYVGKLHTREDGRYCRTFRITYDIKDENGWLPQVTKQHAIKMTIAICHKIDSSFEKGVMVRQYPGEKNFRKVQSRNQKKACGKGKSNGQL